jgi:GNAT superfamily N-acetyltransferase
MTDIFQLGNNPQNAEQELNQLMALYAFLNPEDPALETGAAKKIWQNIGQNPDLHYFGIQIENRLVSTCTLSCLPNLTRQGRPYGLIENVVTHPDFRCRGFATRLLGHAVMTACHIGCYKVMLMTGRKDAATLRFYEQAGFDPSRKQAFVIYPD